jgi:hypothetical protein
MARSHKRTPRRGNANGSDKQDKRWANRRFRQRNRINLQKGRPLVILREVSDPWGFQKDGKRRFDPVKHPELLRK